MSQKMTQKEAVFQAISSVLEENSVVVPEGESFDSHMNRDLRSQVTSILVEGFKGGSIQLDKTFESDAALRVYCSGLTSNWLRKDTRLNGNTKYQPKNPGSRVGSGDAQLKALRALMQTKTDSADRAEIQSFIDARVSAIAATKAKKVEVNFDALPAELRAKFGPQS